MKLRPLGDRLVVRAIEEDSRTVTGLVVPDTAKNRAQKAEVVAVGDGRLDDDGKRVPLEIESGDKVLYHKYGGTEIHIEGEDLLVLRESDILGRQPHSGEEPQPEPALAKPDDEAAQRLTELRRGVRKNIAQLRELAK
jgi:chaperonin GroES